MTRPTASVDPERGVVVLTTIKCTLVLTAEELLLVLLSCPAAWMKAARRGKFEKRGQATGRREGL